MRKLLVLVGLAACGRGSGTGAGPGTGNTTTKPCDVSTEDKAVAFYEQLSGQHVDREHGGCVELSTTFAGWVQFGSFADDLGCEYDRAIYACKVTNADSQQQALADAGYAKADRARRQELVVAVLGELDNVRLSTDDSSNEFPKYGKTFTAPAFDGTSLTAWVSDAGGMSPEVTYTQLTWPVDADGVPGEPAQVDQFTTVYESP